MGFVELLLLAIGLSMDAFAVSVCKGLCMKRLNLRQATVVALSDFPQPRIIPENISTQQYVK